MFGKRITLFKILGFAVRVDISWVFLALLVTWTLAVGYFPEEYKDLSTTAYWWMAIGGALGLFLSIIFHELCHSLVARRHGLPMKGITLFIFGGVAEMSDEPPSPKAELLMAIAGPLSSLVFGSVCYGFHFLGLQLQWPVVITGVLWYVAFINWALAVFNMVPAFPLDGGRVLRSILWGVKGDLRWATWLTAQFGSGFGFLLIFFGLLSVFSGALVGGIWFFLIGMFLRNAAGQSYQQLLLRQALEGEPVSRFMNDEPVSVPTSCSIQDLVDQYIYKHHFKMYPVVEDERLTGCVTVSQVKDVPREEWERKTVGDVAQPCSEENTTSPDADAMKALATMSRNQASRLMVVENGRLVGVLSLKDLLKFFALKVELEEGEKSAATAGLPIERPGS